MIADRLLRCDGLAVPAGLETRELQLAVPPSDHRRLQERKQHGHRHTQPQHSKGLKRNPPLLDWRTEHPSTTDYLGPVPALADHGAGCLFGLPASAGPACRGLRRFHASRRRHGQPATPHLPSILGSTCRIAAVRFYERLNARALCLCASQTPQRSWSSFMEPGSRHHRRSMETSVPCCMLDIKQGRLVKDTESPPTSQGRSKCLALISISSAGSF